ncbi:PIN domain-containing protein [Agrococcus sp. KRD186]|uniref:PIN domain-containing protein n=1 Tax=Agrococcus sp. KRD186 TaxID=2729730 RepID=UPI0019D07118
MIGLDTNVIVRVLIGDDPAQTDAAVELLGSLSAAEPGWISHVVLAETFWVLRRSFRVPTDEIVTALSRLVSANNVVSEQSDVVSSALRAAAAGADFADALIVHGARKAGARTTMTFDVAAASALDGMELLRA